MSLQLWNLVKFESHQFALKIFFAPSKLKWLDYKVKVIYKSTRGEPYRTCVYVFPLEFYHANHFKLIKRNEQRFSDTSS